VSLDVDSLEGTIHSTAISVQAQSLYTGFIIGFDVQHKWYNYVVILLKAEVRNSVVMPCLCLKKVVWDRL
jgi:hypothetical protein